MLLAFVTFLFFQAEVGIRDYKVTGVQTCALPIYGLGADEVPRPVAVPADKGTPQEARGRRSEERRVGKECRSRWSPSNEKKKLAFANPSGMTTFMTINTQPTTATFTRS